MRDGKALANPIVGKILGNQQHDQTGKSHASQPVVCRMNVGTFFPRAATAIEDHFLVAGNFSGDGFQFREALGGGSRTSENCAGNVGAVVESLESDLQNNGASLRRTGEFFRELGHRDLPRVSPFWRDGWCPEVTYPCRGGDDEWSRQSYKGTFSQHRFSVRVF